MEQSTADTQTPTLGEQIEAAVTCTATELQEVSHALEHIKRLITTGADWHVLWQETRTATERIAAAMGWSSTDCIAANLARERLLRPWMDDEADMSSLSREECLQQYASLNEAVDRPIAVWESFPSWDLAVEALHQHMADRISSKDSTVTSKAEALVKSADKVRQLQAAMMGSALHGHEDAVVIRASEILAEIGDVIFCIFEYACQPEDDTAVPFDSAPAAAVASSEAEPESGERKMNKKRSRTQQTRVVPTTAQLEGRRDNDKSNEMYRLVRPHRSNWRTR